MKRFFVQLAHKYKSQDVGGWLMSEKLDGMRAYWDGGVSHGVLCSDVPYANTAKDHIRLEPPIATGLWSRGGKAIPAPADWLANLPPFPLDGELYMGPGNFQQVMSTCKAADRDWSDVEYRVYGRPTLQYQFEAGEICFNTTDKIEVGNECLRFFIDRCDEGHWTMEEMKGCRLRDLADLSGTAESVEQIKLPLRKQDYEVVIADAMAVVMAHGGEGLMLANPHAYWEPHRSHNLLKVKTFEEGEGEVVGYVWGRETDKGSKLAGLMGQLRLKFGRHEFGLSGFTNEERELWCSDGTPADDSDWEPGKAVDAGISSRHFAIGSMVRFKYRELTDDGLPKEARYWR